MGIGGGFVDFVLQFDVMVVVVIQVEGFVDDWDDFVCVEFGCLCFECVFEGICGVFIDFGVGDVIFFCQVFCGLWYGDVGGWIDQGFLYVVLEFYWCVQFEVGVMVEGGNWIVCY